VLDSQSVKGADTVGKDSRGYDAGKKINGRKRFIVTDTAGLLITACVLAASWQDRDGGKTALLGLYLSSPVRHVFADQGFAGRFVDWAATTLKTTEEIVRKPAEQRGFAVYPRRWVGGWNGPSRGSPRIAGWPVTTNATPKSPKPSSAGRLSTACSAGSPAASPPDANSVAPSPGPDQHLKHSLRRG
jgi:Transposase DDE domain